MLEETSHTVSPEPSWYRAECAESPQPPIPEPQGSTPASLLDALLPSAIRPLIALPQSQAPQPSSSGRSSPIDHDLKINVLNGQGTAEVVLWHKAARCFSNAESGEVHQETFSLGDAKKRKKFAETCKKALEDKLKPEDADKLQDTIEEELLWHWQELKANERWRETEGKRPAADKLHAGERKTAEALLKDSSLLYRVAQTITALGVAGETVAGLLLYLAMSSRLMPKILSVAVKAESASGKSFVTDTVLKLFPEEAYIAVSSLSPKALYYDTEEYKHRMLIVAEAAGIGEDAEYTLRTLLSENKLKLKTVDKDLKGRNTSRTLDKEGPTGLILTTTKARMNPENETRYLSIGLDESEEQSQRIKEATAERWAKGGDSVDPEPWINAQKLLEPVEVRVPFGEFLAEKTPTKPKRIRRDFDKLLLLIAASAALHQRQRKTLGKTKDGKKVIQASLVDYFYVRELFEKVFFQSLQGIHPNTRKVMEAIKKLYQASNATAQANPATGLCDKVCVTTQELVEELKKSKPTVLKWAEPLEEYGWVVTQGEGMPNKYRPGSEPNPKKSVLPALDELIAAHPQLVPNASLQATHPVDGRTVKLAHSLSQARVILTPQPQLSSDAIICPF